MNVLFITLRTIAFASAFVWFWGYVALSTRRFDSLLGLVLPPWNPPLGIVLLACGGVLALTCISLFVVRGRGTPAPFDPPRAFVAVGPYTLVRNPMYVGGWLMLAGLGLWERSPAIVLFSAVWVASAHLFVVMYEERTLRKTFDSGYERYVQTVPRWIPTQTPRTSRTPRTPRTPRTSRTSSTFASVARSQVFLRFLGACPWDPGAVGWASGPRPANRA